MAVRPNLPFFKVHRENSSWVVLKPSISYVDFSYMHIRDLNLSDASIMAAKCIGSHLASVQMPRADLTGTSFKNTQLLMVNLEDATMRKVVLNRIHLKGVDLSGANMTNAVYYQAFFKFVTANGLISDDIRLQMAVKKCIYDPHAPMIDANLIDYFQTRKIDPVTQSKSVVILNSAFGSDCADALYRLE